MEHLNLLKLYMKSWVQNDKDQFLKTLHPDIYLVECYGASYVGKDETACWFDDWNSKGRVLSWDIINSYYDPAQDVLIATWIFQFQHPDTQGLEPCFNGVTILKVKDSQIIQLCEYAMKHDLYRPYQEFSA